MQVCTYMCRETHTHTLADTLEKAQPDREREMKRFCHPCCVYPCIQAGVCHICVRVKKWDSCFSCPAQCVTTDPDPDPSQRALSHHQSQSLMALPPSGLHCRVSFERLRGSFAAGCPLSKNMHQTGETEKRMAAGLQNDRMKSHLLFSPFYIACSRHV